MKDIIKPTIKLTVMNTITRVLSLIFFIILARSLAVSDYGLFRYLITVSMIYGIVFTGIPVAIAQHMRKNKNNKTLMNEYLTNGLYTMIALYILTCVYIFIIPEHKIYLILFLFAVFIDVFYGGFSRGIVNYVKLGGHKLLENFIQLIILIISFLIYRSVNFTFAVIFYSFSGLISLIIFEYYKRELRLLKGVSFNKIKELMKYTIPITLGSVGWSIMFGINAIFIKMYHGTSEVAFYSVAETLVQIMAFLPSALSQVMLPKAAGLKDKKRIVKKLTKSVFLVSGASLSILILLYFTKEIFIELLFTDSYLKSATIIMPMAIGYMFIAINQVYSAVYQGFGKPKIPSIIIIIACVVNVILSYFLTKRMDILGAAISLMISSFIALVLILIVFYKEYRLKKWK
jgi:O-antigen/teichoic acid export membrane protein